MTTAALFDRVAFNCAGCAVAPALQTLNGCWTDAPRPVAQVAGAVLRRCPRRSLGPDEQTVLDLHSDGYLTSLSPRDRRRLPAKLVDALLAMEEIKPSRRVDGNG